MKGYGEGSEAPRQVCTMAGPPSQWSELGMEGGGQRIKMNHRHRTYLCGVQGSQG